MSSSPVGALIGQWLFTRELRRADLPSKLVLVGLLRFLIEFVRVNDRVIGPLTVAHVASMTAVAVGLFLLSVRPRAAR